ncbi:MAG: Lrp/AsnC family transcriptional regulator [Actinobacteria bacterium]|nr:Lrp/AsnC family transcriptional regulator [Actinomycetota bacterium]
MPTVTIPSDVNDPVNARILAVSEDRIQGFTRYPLRAIADASGVPVTTVVERIRAMLEAGTIRRVRQTLMSTSLAPGALVAWNVPSDRLRDAFDFMFQQDPFSGHVVLRTTDRETPGSQYRLWTTLKVPRPFSMDAHCTYLRDHVGARAYKLLPARKLFALGVGHVRRRTTEPGDRTPEPGRVLDTELVELTERQWRVLMALKREFTPSELAEDIWVPRAAEAGETIEDFCAVATALNERRVIGRFSTFLEHYKQHRDGSRVTRYNALFHWRVPEGLELRAGREVGRHHCMTHAYWRDGGPEFSNVNIMGVSHGTDKDRVLAHKAAIDDHLETVGIPVEYTNVFWGGRSEIKPSEISPIAYRRWCADIGLDPQRMRTDN